MKPIIKNFRSREPSKIAGVWQQKQVKKKIRASFEAFQKLLAPHEFNLSQRQTEQLWRFHNLLRKHNEECDLTRIYNFEKMVIRHYVDCLLATKYLTLPSPILDIGTGAGFPAIPLKIFFPDLKIIAAEGKSRRVWFLNEVVKALQLKDIEIFPNKIYKSTRLKVKGTITRALETIDKTLSRIENCLDTGGKAFFLKGPNIDEEVEIAKNLFKEQFHLEKIKKYKISNSEESRTLVVFRKI